MVALLSTARNVRGMLASALRRFSTRAGSSGCDDLASNMANTPTSTRPARIGPSAAGEPQPLLSAWPTPKITRPLPAVTVTAPGRSSVT